MGDEEEKSLFEEQYLLRVPPEVAARIRKQLKNKKLEGLQFSIGFDGRTGEFIDDNNKYKLTLVDIPTLMESHKTLDNKTFYKSADVGQMLLVENPDAPQAPQPFNDKFLLDSGVTPPTVKIAKRKWRRRKIIAPPLIAHVQDELDRITRQQTEGIADDFEVEFVDAKEIEGEEHPKTPAAQKDKLKAKVKVPRSIPSTPVPESPRPPSTPGGRREDTDMMDIVKPDDQQVPSTPNPTPPQQGRLLLSISRNKVAPIGSAPATPAPITPTPISFTDVGSRASTPGLLHATPSTPVEHVPSPAPPAPTVTQPQVAPIPIEPAFYSSHTTGPIAPQPTRTAAPALAAELPKQNVEDTAEYVQLASQRRRIQAEYDALQKLFEDSKRRQMAEVNPIMKNRLEGMVQAQLLKVTEKQAELDRADANLEKLKADHMHAQ